MLPSEGVANAIKYGGEYPVIEIYSELSQDGYV